jgi:hypothetical protein
MFSGVVQGGVGTSHSALSHSDVRGLPPGKESYAFTSKFFEILKWIQMPKMPKIVILLRICGTVFEAKDLNEERASLSAAPSASRLRTKIGPTNGPNVTS